MTEFTELAKEFGPYWAIAAVVVGGVAYFLVLIIRWVGSRLEDIGAWIAPRADEAFREHVTTLKTVVTHVTLQTDTLKSLDGRVGSLDNRVGKMEGHLDEVHLHVVPKVKST